MAISPLQIGSSALQAYQRGVDTVANNLANANTPGFKPQRTQFRENTPPGTGVSATTTTQSSGTASQTPVPPIAPTPTATGAPGDTPSATDITTESLQLLVYQRGYEASAKVVKTSDQLLGTLFDAHG